MKRISFSRRAILRAIHNACVALFLAAGTAGAQAQVVTNPFFHVGGTTYTTDPGTFSSGTFYDPSAPYTVTVGSTTTINATTASYGGFTQFYNAGTNIGVGGGTFTNSGTITVSLSNGTGYVSTVALYGSASGVDSTAINSGTLDATSTGGPSVAALSFDNSNGGSGSPPSAFLTTSFSLNNSGTLMGTSSGYGFGVHSEGAGSGSISITNSSTGIISGTSSGNYADAIYAHNNGGAVSVTNAGMITAGGGAGNFTNRGIDAVSSSGPSTVVNQSTGQVLINDPSSTRLDEAINVSGATASGSNAGSISITAGQASVFGLSVHANNTIATATNTGTIILKFAGGGQGMTASSYYGTAAATNAGTIQLTGTGSGYYGWGMAATGSLVNVVNNGSVSVSGVLNATGVNLSNGTSAQSLTVENSGSISVSGSRSAYGISASGYTAPIEVTNSGPISATSSGSYVATGILATTYSQYYAIDYLGPITLTNSGAVTAINNGSGAASSLSAYTAGNISITNTSTGVLTATSSVNSAYGIQAKSTSGNVTITNAGRIEATTGGNAVGIYFLAPNGISTISNSGYAGGFSTGGSLGYGISTPSSAGPVTVSNLGSAVGTTSGIYLPGAVTVNNSGLAKGGSDSIHVGSGSTVNLEGASPVLGLLKGGTDASSTSSLNFNIVIRTGNFSAEKASLDNAITAYGIAYAAAGGAGNVDSSIVVLNGLDYQWEDFFDVADNLVQGRLYAATPGYQGIGNSIDNFNLGSARGAGIIAALDNLPDSGVTNALAQLSPRALQVFRNIAFDGASFTAANVNNHLANLRDGLTGFDTSGFSVNRPGVDPMLTQMRSHLLAFNPIPSDSGLVSDSAPPLFSVADPDDTKTLDGTRPIDPWSAFISGSVVLANLDNTTSNIGDTDYTTGSVLAGVDYRLTNHFTMGALFNYAHTGANLDGNGSKATVDSYAPGVYASYVDQKGWYGNAMLMYGFNNNTDDRQITIPGIQGVNHGAADGGQVTSNMTGGYEFKRGNFKFGPVATLQYVHLTVGSFQEQGPTSLSIDRQEADSLRTQLGFDARYSGQAPTPFGLMTLTPHFQVSWQHEYMDNSDGISSQFNGGAGGGSFVVQGQQPERDSAFLDLGLDAEIAKNVTAFVDYQTQAGQNHYFAQSVQGGVRIGF